MSNKLIISLLCTVLLFGCAEDSDDPQNDDSEEQQNTTEPVDPNPGNGDTGGDTGGEPPIDPALLPQPFDINASYTRHLFVDASSATNGNGDEVNPFNNINSAIQAATAGTKIHINAGTYPGGGSYRNVQGQEDAPIAIVAEGNVIIDAGGNGNGIAFQDARYLVIDGLTIQNTGIHGLNMDDGSTFSTPSEFIVFRNMHIRNIGNGGNQDCLKLSGVDDFYIQGSEFEGCNRGEAIDMVGCHNGVITGNHFHDVAQNAVQTKGGSRHVLIHGNRFEDIPQRAINAGGNTGEDFFRPQGTSYEARDIFIIANIFARTGSAPVVYAGCVDCIVANNTIIDPADYVFRVLQENANKDQGVNGYFVNNIVVFNDAELRSTFFNTNEMSLDNTFVIDGNLWFAQDNNNFSNIRSGSFTIGPDQIVQQDPELNSEYRISSTSPAIGQGVPVPGGLPADFDGNPYPDPSDLGAFVAP